MAEVLFEHEEKCPHTGKTPTDLLLLRFSIPMDILQKISIKTVVVLSGADIFLHTHQLVCPAPGHTSGCACITFFQGFYSTQMQKQSFVIWFKTGTTTNKTGVINKTFA